MSIKAYSYIRFSTLEQRKGDSLRRQKELSKDYASKNKLVLDSKLNMEDKGLSAYDGKNIKEGALGKFLGAVESGMVERGSYLLVESLDRISREAPKKALEIFLSILRQGIIIVTLTDKSKYDYETLDTTELLTSIILMSRAHEESATKGKRIKSAWDKKRDDIDKVKLTKWSPKWVNLSDDRTEFLLDEERAKIVNQIFKYSAQGLGASLIIKKLENDNVKPWDMGKDIKQTKRKAKKWHAAYILRILHNRAVLGELQLRKADKNEGHEVIKDYFPQIVSKELFHTVQESIKSRRVSKRNAKGVLKKRGTGGRKGEYLSNLFSKIAICGYSIDSNLGMHRCAGNNEVMSYINKGKNSRYFYLQCSRVKDGNTGCEKCHKMWRYDYFETSFLTHIKDIDVSVLLGNEEGIKSEIEGIKKCISTAEGEINNCETEIKKIDNAVLKFDVIPKFLITNANKYENEIRENEILLIKLNDTLTAKELEYSNSEKTEEQLFNLIDVMNNKTGDDLFDIRLKLSETLKQVIKNIEVYPCGKIYSDKYYKNIKDKISEDAYKFMLEHKNTFVSKKEPFFVVRYKSGESRIVRPDPKDPAKLSFSFKLSEDNILIEKEFGYPSTLAKFN